MSLQLFLKVQLCVCCSVRTRSALIREDVSFLLVAVVFLNIVHVRL